MYRLAEWRRDVHRFFTYTWRYYYIGLIRGRKAMCAGKVRYHSWVSADRAASNMSTRYNARKEPYPCIWCKRWHVGKKP